MPQNTPAVNNIQTFLKMIFGDAWIHAEVCSVPALGQDDKYKPFWNTRPAGACIHTLNPDWNNYFCVSLMDTPGIRRKANFKALRVLAVDDVGPKVDPALTRATLGEPTYRLETSPGNEQWGYVLDPPVTDRTQATALIDAAIRALAGGKDPGMAGVTRLMRLPFGANTKHTPAHASRVVASGGPTHDPAKLPAPLDTATPPVPEPDPFDAGTTPAPIPVAPGQSRADPTLIAMRKLGLVRGNARKTAQGTGWDVTCPWVHEHSPSTAVDTGTVYFRGGGFKCWHGHCDKRSPEDVRRRVDEMISDMTGGLFGLGDFDPNRFDAVDPAKVPPSPLPPNAGPDTAREFWDATAYLAPEEKFINLTTGEELSERAFNACWAPVLRDYLPEPKGKKTKAPTPATWYLGNVHRRRILAGRDFAPGQPRVFRCVTLSGGTESRLNLWIDISTKTLALAPSPDLDTHVRTSDWWALIDALCGNTTFEDTENARRLRFYMAMTVGAVNVKPGHNPLLIGQQGTGKEQIWAPLIQVLGPERATTVSQTMFNGIYNAWMMNRLVMMAEVRHTTRGVTTDHDQYTALKRMCDPGRKHDMVNEKYMKAINVRNIFVLVMTSNEDRPMTLPEDDRRIWVINVKDPGWDDARHQRLAAWFEAPAPWGETNAHAVVEWLIRYWDESIMLDEVLGKAPLTRDKLELIERGAGPVLTWLRDTLGRVPPDPLTLPDIFTSGDIVDRLTHAVRHGGQGVGPGVRVPSVETVGRYLVKAGCRKLNHGKATGSRGQRFWARRDVDPGLDNMTATDLLAVYAAQANRRGAAGFD